MVTRPTGIRCTCHRCEYQWSYFGSSKYIACCPRCKMGIYIPKMLRIINEAQSRNLDVDNKYKNSLDVIDLESRTSSVSTHQKNNGGQHE
jgi:hypothetical protein